MRASFVFPLSSLLALAAGCAVGDESAALPDGVAPKTAVDMDADGWMAPDDCDDANAAVNPDAAEADNLLDDDCDGWVDEDFVIEGDLVFTEVNRQARFGGRATVNDGTWIELYNTSERTLNLANWTFARGTSASGNQITIDPAAAPLVGPGEYVLLCDTDNYVASATAAFPLTCDYVWGDETQASTYRGTWHDNTLYIRRDQDTVAMYVEGDRTSGRAVDELTWYYDATNGYWPRDARFSMSLDPWYYDGVFNDMRELWCSTTSTSTGAIAYTSTWSWYDVLGTPIDEYGTPGAANYDCPVDPDLDGDGYPGSTDCDEADASIHPDAREVCDDVDNDCDGVIDEDTGAAHYYHDGDGDGYGDGEDSVRACAQPDGYVTDKYDCNDADASIHPGAEEVCDGVDQDCNEEIDEGEIAGDILAYPDMDEDGYGASDSGTMLCMVYEGWTTVDGDCDDGNDAVNPDGTESDNVMDDNCDGFVDEGYTLAGDLVITEVNRQARFGAASTNPDGSWVEVYNATGRTVVMDNWTIARGSGSTGRQVTIDPADGVVLAPYDFVVFCDTATYEGSATAAYPLWCDYVWGDPTQASTYRGTYHDNTFTLRRDNDSFAVYADGTTTTGRVIDTVTWYYDATNGYWPRDARFSMSLDPAWWTATANDAKTGWCSTTVDSAGALHYDTTWRWYDVSGTAYDEYGTPGATNYDCPVEPPPMGALAFDGDDRVTIPGTASIDLSGGFSVQAWVRTTDASPDVAVVGAHQCRVPAGWFLGMASAYPTWYVAHDPRLYGSGALNDGAWHLLTGTYDGTWQTLYVDGVWAGSQPSTGTLSVGVDWNIGAYSEHCSGYVGEIDDVALWDRALTVDEVSASVGAPLTGTEPGLLAAYTFEGTIGEVVPDISGQGRDGVLGTTPASGEGDDPEWVDGR